MGSSRDALIVASYDFSDPGLRRLRAPAHDADALAEVLRDPEIGDFAVRTVLNRPAHEVAVAIERFFADRSPDDTVLLHFSGHGVKDQNGDLYFAAADTDLSLLGATAVAADFVNKLMARTRSRRVLLFLDCCYAGAFERGLATRGDSDLHLGERLSGRGRAVITASTAMEYAFEGGQLTDATAAEPSVFTSALVEALRSGEADTDQDGYIGLDELYEYVYDKVRRVTPSQTPSKWAMGFQGEFHVADPAPRRAPGGDREPVRGGPARGRAGAGAVGTRDPSRAHPRSPPGAGATLRRRQQDGRLCVGGRARPVTARCTALRRDGGTAA
jgi:uncharacterized caspase-like protein